MSLKAELIKLGYSQPHLRPHLRTILASLEKQAAHPVPKKHVKEAMERALRESGPGSERVQKIKVEKGPKTDYRGRDAHEYTVTLKHSADQWVTRNETYLNNDDFDYDQEEYEERMKEAVGQSLAAKWQGYARIRRESARETVYWFIFPFV